MNVERLRFIVFLAFLQIFAIKAVFGVFSIGCILFFIILVWIGSIVREPMSLNDLKIFGYTFRPNHSIRSLHYDPEKKVFTLNFHQSSYRFKKYCCLWINMDNSSFKTIIETLAADFSMFVFQMINLEKRLAQDNYKIPLKHGKN